MASNYTTKPSEAVSKRDRTLLCVGPYTPRVRDPNEATPPQISAVFQPVYIPQKDLAPRIGLART